MRRPRLIGRYQENLGAIANSHYRDDSERGSQLQL